MNDFDYEVLQRKRLAQQAKHRKNGSKSKKCSLPSDGMSHKQWKERNGEIMEYNLGKPMVWKVFKYMPKDLQKQYLEKLVNEHHGTQREIAAMLGVGSNTLCTYCTKRGLTGIFIQNKGVQGGRPEWQDFLTQDKTQEAPVIAPPPEDGKPALEPCYPPYTDSEATANKGAMSCKASFQLAFEGQFNWYAVMEQLTRYVKDGETVQLTIYGAILPPSDEG